MVAIANELSSSALVLSIRDNSWHLLHGEHVLVVPVGASAAMMRWAELSYTSFNMIQSNTSSKASLSEEAHLGDDKLIELEVISRVHSTLNI